MLVMAHELQRRGNEVQIALLRREGELLGEVGGLTLISNEVPRVVAILERIWFLRKTLIVASAFILVPKILRQLGSGVLITQTFSLSIIVAIFSRRLTQDNISWIIFEGSNHAAEIDRVFRLKFLCQALQKVFGAAYRKAKAIIAVSATVRGRVISDFRVPVPRVHLVPNAIDLRQIERACQEVAPFRFRYVLAAGRLVKVKQFDMLIRAFAKINSDLRLVILGEGYLRAALEKLAMRLNVSHRIVFAGFHKNPWVYMRHAEAFVCSSKLEGFSNVTLEAMAAGCPVVSTRCGGPEDFIVDGKNGVLVEMNDLSLAQAISQLSQDGPLRKKLGRHALKTAWVYRVENIVRNFETALKGHFQNDCKT